ncbi:tyrosine-type recombinase/integrase [Halomonas sp. SH5A2]|uniref:tyrosine-type recombinase/integrase n=1 Tax=Halomonas sp. SH5A2 TaxID=2749040 RepID=UPI00164014D7|nr:tyrosine-type recombinase/integrase [Halomonas sp. SH5A2]QNI04094.1 tyrosine-type recombinase/integrase [Halomonas sp. SH5A2]
MNEVEFYAEQHKTLHAVQAGTIDSNVVITGMRLEDGSYHVLSRYDDDVWVLPDSLFSAAMTDSLKKINFLNAPVVFRETLRACTARYILSGIEGRNKPRGATIRSFFVCVVLFLHWLHDRRVARLSDLNPLIGQQYVEFCKGLESRERKLVSGATLFNRFLAVEKLHILSQQSGDAMRHPWPDMSAKHLAGLTGKNNPVYQEAKTEIIPDDILGPLFQSAVEWLERIDEVISLRAQVEGLKAEGRSARFIQLRVQKIGWTLNGIRKAEQHLQTACMCIILITSGIRVSELCSLENQCAFKKLDENGEPFHWMRGTSYKTGVGSCEWLVSKITHRALTVAEKLVRPLQAKLEQRIFGLRTDNPRDTEIVRLGEHTHRLFLGVTTAQGNRIVTLSSTSILTRLKAFARQCGLDWGFTPHQFRRTFAVYAAHSALGDLRYLRDHFKHWSLDMTILYAMSRLQDAELYDSVGLAALTIKTELLEHWLEPDAILVGGAAETIRAFRTKSEGLATKIDRAEMAKTISPIVHLRATGVAWCTADTGGCNGGQGIEKTRCADCSNAVIDESRKSVWQGIYAQQLELRELSDIGPGGTERVERDIKRCAMVLKNFGATEEDLADVET